jgi:flagellin-like protein
MLQEDDIMKIGYRKKWKDDAVSPVIATILMVAITVVLAAVLYLLVSSIIDLDGRTPQINLRDGELDKPGWIVEVASVTEVNPLNNYQVSVLRNSSIAIAAIDLDEVKRSGASYGALNLTFFDATGDDGLNAGDWFLLAGTDTISDYQITIHWKTTGNKVSGESGGINQ